MYINMQQFTVLIDSTTTVINLQEFVLASTNPYILLKKETLFLGIRQYNCQEKLLDIWFIKKR